MNIIKNKIIKMSKNTKWYVIKTVTNKEKKCKEQIDSEISQHGYNTHVNQVVIPMEKIYHVRNGKKVASERNHYPGYILIETDPLIIGELTVMLKGINFVSGFLGADDKSKEPVALRPSEVTRILGKMDELANADETVLGKYFIGERVKLIDGPFNSFIGKVTDVNEDKKKLKLNVKIFGRETPLEVNYSQVTKDD
jgi:transcription termination/antitermination protein NusG